MKKNAPHRRFLHFAGRHAHLDTGVQSKLVLVIRLTHFRNAREPHVVLLLAQPHFCEVVQAEDHVLRGHSDRAAVGRTENIVARKHEHPGLQAGVMAEGRMHRHLVPIEIGIEGRAYQRMQPDGFALDENRLECLYAKAMQCGGPVQHDRTPFDHLLENIPDVSGAAVHYFLCTLDRLDDAPLNELANDKGLEQFDSHLFRQAALVYIQFGANDDNRPTRIIHALAEQVLPEPSLLALEHIAERLQGPVRITAHGVCLAAVVEQRIDRLLQHALLVAQNDFRGLDVDEPFQPVVADDYAAVQIVQIGSGEPSSLKRNQRAQLRRNNRNDPHNHPLGPIFEPCVGVAETFDDCKALQGHRPCEPDLSRS